MTNYLNASADKIHFSGDSWRHQALSFQGVLPSSGSGNLHAHSIGYYEVGSSTGEVLFNTMNTAETVPRRM